MIEELKMFKNIIPTKTIIPIFNHIHFYNNRIQGSDGACYLDIPFETALEMTVPFEKLRKAFELLEDPIISLTDEFLTIKKGRSRIKLAANKGLYPAHESFDTNRTIFRELYSVLKNLRPFVAEDASRSWAQSINIVGGYAYATNNVTVVRQKIIDPIPNMVIPLHLIEKLLILISEETVVTVSENQNFLQFEFGADNYLSGVKLATSWPDVTTFIVKSENCQPVTKEIFDTVTHLVPFCNNDKMPFLFFDENGIHTDEGDSYANVEVDSFPKAIFRAEIISKVLHVAKEIDFSSYPKGCYFKNDFFDGVVLGVTIT